MPLRQMSLDLLPKSQNDTFPNSRIPYIRGYVRLVCALCNAFRPPRVEENTDSQLIAQIMLRLASQPNRLQSRVEKEGWTRKKVFWFLLTEDSLQDFSRLTLDELCCITLSVY